VLGLGRAYSATAPPPHKASIIQSTEIISRKPCFPLLSCVNSYPLDLYDMLCSKCSNIHFQKVADADSPILRDLQQRFSEDVVCYIHHESVEALWKSSAAGCHFCVMLLDRLTGRDSDDDFTSDVVYLYKYLPHVDVNEWFGIRCGGREVHGYSLGETFGT
jgi:hypothetical protein